MTDFFSLLGIARAPWPDAENLKIRFLSLSAEAHPDRFHSADETTRAAANARYIEINNAHQTLRETRPRLAHLLELELSNKPPQLQQILPETMNLFMEVSQICRQIDAFLAEKSKAASPMLKVALFAQGMEWLDRVTPLQQKVSAQRAALETELESMNPAWLAAPPPDAPAERRATLPLKRLEEIYRLTSYLDRWSGQLQERAVQLSL
jgi:DnaJ-domain-containing protein 1